MRREKIAIATILATFIVTYLCLAFVRLELNPVLWSDGDRMLLCYLAIGASWFTAGLPYVLFRDEPSK